MEIVISFDDTGSMSSCRAQVRRSIKELVDELFKLDPATRIGIIIHGDYCDRDTIQHIDLTNDRKIIEKFINWSGQTGGGDADECYELAINYMHSKFSWTEGENKVAILIGDCHPHQVGYKYGSFTNKLNWKEEVSKCMENGIKVYPVQALHYYKGSFFYNGIAKMCGTPKLDLMQFAHITQYITAIAYQEGGKLEEYESSSEEFKTNNSLKRMFSRLKGIIVSEEFEEDEEEYYSGGRTSRTRSTKDYGSGDGTATIDIESRFQVLEVGTSPRVIKEFVEDNGATFKKGRGFYQFILTETIQENKEVLMVDKATGETKSDTVWCRKQIGVPLGTRGRVNPKTLDCAKKYDIFIQSTSYNRKLDPNTKFLYELDHK